MSSWSIKILHLGLGRFHRAHQASYYQDLYEKSGEGWGVVAFSMRSAKAKEQLNSVDCRYPVVQFSKDSAELQWIESIREAYFTEEDKDQLMFYFASVEITLLTLTVTEKAYQTKDLISLIYEGLKHRKESINQSLTVLSCDNLQANGDKLKQSLLRFAQDQKDKNTHDWIFENVAFPNTMVDRIVPAPSLEKVTSMQKQFKIENPEILATEFFKQWVIEDNFKCQRPPLDKVGVQFVKDVKPFEEIKLRLLNASHSLIAYTGLIKGYEFVHQAIADVEIRQQVENLYTEVIPLIEQPKNFDLKKYTNDLFSRFENKNLPHQLQQIAMDGSQKLPQRIFPSLLKAIAQNTPRTVLQETVQSWINFCFQNTPNDPLKEKIEKMKSLDKNEFRIKLLSEILDPHSLQIILKDLNA